MCEIYTDRPKEAELNDVILREAQSNDCTLLWEFLAIAAYEPSARAAQDVPVISVLLDGWKRPGDFGCIAELDGTAIGAAWARQFELDDKPAVYAGPEIPEITIGVRPEVHARGVGARLLHWLEQAARDRGCHGLCLFVRDTNPAIRLYERVGYRRISGSEVQNRMGGISVGMLLTFSSDH